MRPDITGSHVHDYVKWASRLKSFATLLLSWSRETAIAVSAVGEVQQYVYYTEYLHHENLFMSRSANNNNVVLVRPVKDIEIKKEAWYNVC